MNISVVAYLSDIFSSLLSKS